MPAAPAVTAVPAGPTPTWVTDLLGEGASLVGAVAVAGGSSRETVLVELPTGAGRVVARHDRDGGPLSGTPFDLAREAATYAAVARAGIPVPAVRAVASDGRAFAVDLVPGSPSRGAEALDDYLAALGHLHAAGLAPRPGGVSGFDASGRDDLNAWEQVAATRLRRPAPLVDEAFAALRRHGAFEPPEVVVCHGDAGQGNYLYADGVVTGLVDWELAHTGDPHDDLASVAVRAMLAGADLGDYPARVAAAYEPVAGIRFDRRRHLVGVAAVLTRMVISCRAALDHRRPGMDVSVQLLGLPVMEAQLLRSLARLDGDPVPAFDRDPAEPDLGFAAEVAAVVGEGLGRDVLPELRGGAAEPSVRRMRYAATQLAASLLPTGSPPGPEQVAARLAVLPASRALAVAPVAGVDGC